MAEIREIPVEKIEVGENVLRMELEDDAIDELAESIRRVGLLNPLVVIPDGQGFRVVAGHRRLEACRRAGLRQVHCCVRTMAQEESTEISLAENLFRKDLSPVEMAAGISDTIKRAIMDVDQVAVALHRSVEWVHRMVALLDWPADVLEAIHAGWLSVSAAHNVALIEDDTYRVFLLRNAKDSGATARTTAAWLQAWRSMAPVEKAVEAPPVPGEVRTLPMVPQAPCLCCGQVFRSDQLSHVPVCAGCIQAIRSIGTGG